MNCPKDKKRCYRKFEGGLPKTCRHNQLIGEGGECPIMVAYWNKIIHNR
jgi:hypothetical protein